MRVGPSRTFKLKLNVTYIFMFTKIFALERKVSPKRGNSNNVLLLWLCNSFENNNDHGFPIKESYLFG